MRSFGKVLEDYRGIGPGFDFLRIALALGILFIHSSDVLVVAPDKYESPLLAVPSHALVPAFFALSGFLVTGSAQRLRLWDFVLNRALRIVPALAVDVVFAACVIGAIFTTLPLERYYTDPLVFRYFANISGFISYYLPGVFLSNPMDAIVNGSLWTVPFEIACYVVMSAFIATKLLGNRRRFLIVSACLAALVIVGVTVIGRHFHVPETEVAKGDLLTMNSAIGGVQRGYLLIVYFLAGCIAYLFRDRIPYHKVLAIGSVLGLIALTAFSYVHPGMVHLKILLCLPFLTYLTVFVGLSKIPPVPYYHRGDYSYGVYLYGYPLQQALVAEWPGRWSLATHFLASAILTTAFATFSWHVIEKPILGLRRKFSFTARKGEPPRDQVLPEPEPGSTLAEDGDEAETARAFRPA